MKTQYFMPTPLQQRVSKQITDGNPRAFAIADLGQGPILTYRGHHVRLDCVSIDLARGTQHIEIPRLDLPPYTVLLAQEGTRVSLCLYMSQNATPVLEHNVEDGMRGQVFGAAFSKDGEPPMLAHALFQPTFSSVFTSVSGHESLLMEQHPELCNHCTLCAAMIGELLCITKGDKVNEF